MTLPRWVTQDVLDTLKRIASFEVTYSIVSHKRKEKARLSGGEDSQQRPRIGRDVVRKTLVKRVPVL